MPTKKKMRKTSFKNTNNLEHFDAVIWMGDMNYRVTASNFDVTHKLIQKNRFDILMAQDQLTVERILQRNPIYTYKEGEINFAPTFKHIRETFLYNPKRNPSWADRILYRSNDDILNQMNYDSHNLVQLSDHRPVFSQFTLKFDINDAKNKQMQKELMEKVRKAVQLKAIEANAKLGNKITPLRTSISSNDDMNAVMDAIGEDHPMFRDQQSKACIIF